MQSISQSLTGPRQNSSGPTGSPRGPHGQLPIWPEAVRGGPNAILRSALFAGIHSKKRQELGTKTRPDMAPGGIAIASQEGIEITFAGTQFNQYDADVFFETIHRARRQQLVIACQFQGADFLKSIGRSCSTLCYEDLEQSLERLRRGSVDLKWTANGRQLHFTGGLIAYFIRETITKTYKITFAEEILTLFSPASWTQLEWTERQALKGKPLSQWLHSYFSTHASPFPVSVGFLHEKSGSPTKLQKHFKTELKNALEALEATLGWTIAWNGDLVTVGRPPSACQTRHLAKKAAKAKRMKEMRETSVRHSHGQLPLGTQAAPANRLQGEQMPSTRQILAGLLNGR
jgi:hypothetical protein